MIKNKKSLDENRRIDFLKKEEEFLIKCMEILEKVTNIIKSKFNSRLIYSKKYLKIEKKNKHKRRILSISDLLLETLKK